MKRIVLVGAGHAHLRLLAACRTSPLYGSRLTLVSPAARQVYSGMLPGVVAGHYRRAEAEVDVARLCELTYAQFVQGEVGAIDLDARQVRLADRTQIAYDYLSLNVGSRIAPPIPGAQHALAVKPFERFLDRLGEAPRIAIAGAGAAGVEIAMALRWRGAAVTVYSASASMPAPMARRAIRVMRRLGVDYRAGMALDAIEPGLVVHAGAARQEFDQVLLATGAQALPWLRATGLQCDEYGFVAVQPTLQSVSHPEVFAAGDCAALPGVPKSGVYAVRQGEALAQTFARVVRGEPPAAFVPQPRALLLLSCGARRAIAQWGNWSAEGAWTWRWKSWIDRRWLDSLR